MNKESDWDECLRKKNALTITPDHAKADSLTEIAEGRVKFLDNIEDDSSNLNYLFEGYYASILELLHAILIRKGFKVLNHNCVGFYLRDVLKKPDLFRTFDDLRYKRNSLIYYGNQLEEETAKEAIEKCKKTIEELKSTN